MVHLCMAMVILACVRTSSGSIYPRRCGATRRGSEGTLARPGTSSYTVPRLARRTHGAHPRTGPLVFRSDEGFVRGPALGARRPRDRPPHVPVWPGLAVRAR